MLSEEKKKGVLRCARTARIRTEKSCAESVFARHLRRFEMPSEADVRQAIEDKLAPSYLHVHDFSDGCGAKFDVYVVSSTFEGKKLLERHRLVNEALSSLMSDIHAVTLKTMTPEQHEKNENKPTN